jgi:hypothetical protein
VAALLSLLVALAAPAPALAAQTPGVQVHPLWAGVDRAQARRQLQRAADGGARMVRIDVGWASVEHTGRRRWSRWYLRRLDDVVAAARARRLRPLLTVFGTPCWASTAPARLRQGCRGRWWERGVERYAPRDPADYARALAFLVRRYGARVAAWEVWNEPNQSAFFRARDPARDYARLLRAAHRAVKRADPRATVVGGSLAEADHRFTDRVLRLGARRAFDAWSVHPYSGDRSPLDPASGQDSEHSFVRGVPAVRRALLRQGARRPLWLTELGWSTASVRGGRTFDNGVDAGTQARFLTEAFTQVRDWPYVDVAIWYALHDTSRDPGDLVGNFGLLRADGSAKPSFATFRWMATLLRAR